jgi:hypothetical protein
MSVPVEARPAPTVSEAPASIPIATSVGPSARDAADEIECDLAEEYADFGDFEAGDIADYCDYGPDPGELPDEFDWDE